MRFRNDEGREPTEQRGRRHPGAHPAHRARHRAGRHPQGGPGPEHLHLLHRVLPRRDGRHRRSGSSSTRCATSTPCRSPATTSPRPGANPISQLAFTLANGFTYVEAYLARGMKVDDFAPNLSFFFSNGMDPEYTVLGRVARRIWAVAMRDRYGANDRSQKLKYHVQTSGRSLHAQEMAFNDIRTTLQALCAIYDNANSLHTNAYDEAVTTPTAESVRRGAGHPAGHQPRVGPGDEREPAAGQLHRRGAHRARRGGGARRARPDRRARRRARGDGDRLPARPDPGRVDALRAPQARRHAADRRGQHVPRPERRRGHATRSSWPAATTPRSTTRSTGCAASRPSTPPSPCRCWSACARRRSTATTSSPCSWTPCGRCSLGEITDTLFEVGGRYRRNV